MDLQIQVMHMSIAHQSGFKRILQEAICLPYITLWLQYKTSYWGYSR